MPPGQFGFGQHLGAALASGGGRGQQRTQGGQRRAGAGNHQIGALKLGRMVIAAQNGYARLVGPGREVGGYAFGRFFQ